MCFRYICSAYPVDLGLAFSGSSLCRIAPPFPMVKVVTLYFGVRPECLWFFVSVVIIPPGWSLQFAPHFVSANSTTVPVTTSTHDNGYPTQRGIYLARRVGWPNALETTSQRERLVLFLNRQPVVSAT